MHLEAMRRAIAERDHLAIEGLRSEVTAEDVRALASDWQPDLEPATKDCYIALLMDRAVPKHPELAPMMIDALSSRSEEVRVYAACSILGDFDVFTKVLAGHWPQARLEAALEQLRTSGSGAR